VLSLSLFFSFLSLVGACRHVLTSSFVCVCSLMLAWLEPLVLLVYDGFLELVYVSAKAFELSVVEGWVS
jgi:hypothetical protein